MDNLAYKENNASLIFYGLFIFLTVYLGTTILRKSESQDIYTSFILKWKNIMLDYQSTGVPVPKLDKNNPVLYMKNLSQAILKRDLVQTPPDFTRQLKLASGEVNDVFLLAQKNALHIYGLDKNTINNLDKMIDGKNNLAAGQWVAFPYKKDLTYHAVWFYNKT